MKEGSLPVAHAYTAGLKVSRRTTVRKERILPVSGEVLVAKGSSVRAETVVARAHIAGSVSSVNVVAQLGISPGSIREYMMKREGDPVEQGEVIAATKSRFKWFRTLVRSPATGTVETVSTITGQVLIRHPPRPVEIPAYLDGTVVEVREAQGVVVEAEAAYVQGIFGVGGEATGTLRLACDRPGESVGPEALTADMAGAVVVVGERITSALFSRSRQIGIAALIGGGIHDSDLRGLLGYDIGVAITGQEAITPTLIMTEGFGEIAMARTTFEVLRSHAGRRASVNGATQIRAGVVRPEVIVPLGEVGHRDDAAESRADRRPSTGLEVGMQVRIIREPGFGRIGTVVSLPAGLVRIETEAEVRVVEVRCEDGGVVVVPRANVEVIEQD